MSMLNDRVRKDVEENLQGLKGEVALTLFTSADDCPLCDQTRELLTELTGLSEKLSLQVRDMEVSREIADHYRIDKAPAIVVEGEKDYGIRFYGIPSGYEFGTLLEVIRLVGQGDPELRPELTERLAGLTSPVHLQVFVTPTCPYCPQAVVAAHRLAMASEHVTADMVEATEFPELSQKFRVMGVPRTVMSEAQAIEGAVPEEHLLEWVLAESGASA